MDWPGRTPWSRIAFRWRRLRMRPNRRDARPPPLATPTRRDDRSVPHAGVTETLHSLGRQGDHLPLFVLTVTDREGRLLDVAACDADEYAE
jgi:hypothetical protein